MAPRLPPLTLCALSLGAMSFVTPVYAQQQGVKLIGRWLIGGGGARATYAGSEVLLSFSGSSSVAADFTVAATQGNRQDLYIAVTVDGGKPVRIGLSPGEHPAFAVATGLSAAVHQVVVRKEGEAFFGVLRFSNPRLGPTGHWRAISDDRPIVEVIGDSDATGICALGPDSPARAAPLFTAVWASETDSWVGLLEAGLAGVGHPVDMVDLAISGSNTKEEAAAYDLTAYAFSDARFREYPPPGRAHASLVFLWGGGNDRHGGGDTALHGGSDPDSLSPFQIGIDRQLQKIFARNPDVRVVLLEYIDPAIPDWRPAYEEVMSRFSVTERERMFVLAVHDPPAWQDACEADPKGHPNVSMHTAWASQILAWMLGPGMLQRLGFTAGEQWDGVGSTR